jgi:hypothetical protein
MLAAFIENLEAAGSHVYTPNPFVLLCGGARSGVDIPKPVSLRDAFLKSEFIGTIKNADVHQVEDIQEYFDKDAPYVDLVTFERDIAQLSDLVLLFSESPGSFTELGVFSSYKEIYSKTLVVIQQKYLGKDSFIAKGPIAFLSGKSEKAVFSLTNASIGLRGNSFENVKPAKILELLKSPIGERLKEAEGRKTLNKNLFSHRCKLYIAFLREFIVLKDEEIFQLFSAFDINLSKNALDKITFCCKCVLWSKTARAGFHRIHFALDGKEAAKFTLGGGLGDRIRRRLEFRRHWEETDPARLEARSEALQP